MLRCSSGQVSHVQIDESLGLHLAFFEWDGTDTGSVLEAFRHMPEACMGAIGMKLIEKAPPRTYVVRGREDRGQGSGDRGQESEVGRDPARSAHLSPAARDDKDQELGDRGQNAENRSEAEPERSGDGRRQMAGGKALANLENRAAGVTGMAAAQQGNSEISGQGLGARMERSDMDRSERDVPAGDRRRAGSTQEENPQSSINNLSRQSAAATDHKTCPGEAREDGSEIPPSSPNLQSPISNLPSLVFDHTIFREPGQGGGAAFASGPLVHAFRAVWVAGLSHADARSGLGGNEFNRLRTIRLQSALTRFRPTHARVIQGAVRGASSGDAAWQAFEQAMLKHLTFER